MNPNPSPNSSAFETSSAICNCRGCGCSSGRVSWAAIFAGASAALACEVLFMLLGAGLGFAIYSPLADSEPMAALGTGAAVIQGISAVLALWLGGWVAGRFTPAWARATGWLHGFSVWCVATVAGVLFVSIGAGWALGDLSKLVAGGLSMAGKPAAALAGDAAKDAPKQTSDMLGSFVDEAVGSRGGNPAANLTIRAKREIGLAVARLFNPAQQASMRENRVAAVRALVDHAGMNEASAERAIADWTASYERLKADIVAVKDAAAAKAREAADKAADALALLSLCYFVGFLLGAVAASWGGSHGVACAVKREERVGPGPLARDGGRSAA